MAIRIIRPSALNVSDGWAAQLFGFCEATPVHFRNPDR
jgi:hypothetical protein